MSNDKVNNTKSRLNDLKEQLKADPVQLDTSDITADISAFPDANQTIKYIDYDDEKKNHKEFAEQSITNIITTYVKSEKLLNSPRLKDLKQTDIIKYSRLLLMVEIAESNLIKLQESIDGGDMSKDMFMSVKQASMELRDCMNSIEKHLDKCEKYWSNYSIAFGLSNDEEKIIAESSEKSTDDKRTILNISELTNNIHDILAKQKEKEKQNNKEKD